MAVPIILATGTILVYGWGNDNSLSGIVPDNNVFKFSTVYQIWDGGATFVYGGDSVMWREGDQLCKLAYAGNPYTILPARLVTKENYAP